MTPTITIAVMLAVTLGAALYVAWPLLFGRVRPEDYLVVDRPEPASARVRTGMENSRAAGQIKTQRKATVAGARVDLDVEQEIEAFRRRSKQSGERVAVTCASCGQPLTDPDAAFCSKCGARVSGNQGQNSKKTGRSREDR